MPNETSEPPMPSLPQQAWNLTKALADFVADGCTLVSV